MLAADQSHHSSGRQLVTQTVLRELLAERGAMDAERAGGGGTLAAVPVESRFQQRRLDHLQQLVVHAARQAPRRPATARPNAARPRPPPGRSRPTAPSATTADTLAGRCSGRIARPRAMISACSIALRSSRTLPCHGRRSNSASASAVSRAACSLDPLASRPMK